MAREFVVSLVTGEPQPAEWCDACVLPSQVQVGVFMLTNDGLTKVGVWEGCSTADCPSEPRGGLTLD
ncbi:hypothetical protein IMZ11_41330 [Microtetraspora sp. AC03309]|uniref:hypothetical protein n=1 Tax=Microtetraspora sp. AC03309 TaxID=2779376 RepID=UPI001E3975BD|nr:hypothetical protein [Microtetraspora sp. AC03309]MCC5582061.1 hypothetical protein [Microtetraspora sp. AC03309]